MPLHEAIIRAGEIRFLPVLLTTMTAIGGLLPIALSRSGMYSPLAWVIIGGLITSTVLSLVVIPVIFTFVDDFLEVLKHVATGTGSSMDLSAPQPASDDITAYRSTAPVPTTNFIANQRSGSGRIV